MFACCLSVSPKLLRLLVLVATSLCSFVLACAHFCSFVLIFKNVEISMVPSHARGPICAHLRALVPICCCLCAFVGLCARCPVLAPVWQNFCRALTHANTARFVPHRAGDLGGCLLGGGCVRSTDAPIDCVSTPGGIFGIC